MRDTIILKTYHLIPILRPKIIHLILLTKTISLSMIHTLKRPPCLFIIIIYLLFHMTWPVPLKRKILQAYPSCAVTLFVQFFLYYYSHLHSSFIQSDCVLNFQFFDRLFWYNQHLIKEHPKNELPLRKAKLCQGST